METSKLIYIIYLKYDSKEGLLVHLTVPLGEHTSSYYKLNIKYLNQVGDIALINGKIEMAISCFQACDDLSGLLLIYSSLGLKERLKQLAKRAEELTRTNIAFICYFNLVKTNI